MSDISQKILGALREHQDTLKSISDLIQYNPGLKKSDSDNNLVNMLLYIKKDPEYFRKGKLTGKIDKAFQNLNNAWYHEAAFNDKSSSPEDPYTIFLPWKIIQFYYSIFHGISSIVRCHNDKGIDNHIKMINDFTTLCLRNKKLSYNFFISPYCFYLDKSDEINPSPNLACSWSYGVSTHIPYLKDQMIKLKYRPCTIYHYFLELRNWANYYDAYIFRNLYSDTIKTNIYFSLKRILLNFMLLNEIYFISYFGYDEIKSNMESFYSDFNKNFGSNSRSDTPTTPISLRLQYYESYGEGILY